MHYTMQMGQGGALRQCSSSRSACHGRLWLHSTPSPARPASSSRNQTRSTKTGRLQRRPRCGPPAQAATAAGPADAAPAAAEALQQRDAGPAGFDWHKHWYPVLPLESLDPKLPMHVDLLGLNLVVWADAQGAWHCLEDRCPHRLAPLSEGRVEAGGLMCSYHGWTFAGQGTCVRIPQIDDPKAHATACASPRSCAKAYPTKVFDGLLWVWPEGGPAGAAAAAVGPPPLASANPEGARTPWFVRDLPLRHDTLVENLIDPSHVSFAHHGIQGQRSKPVKVELEVKEVGREGFDAVPRTPFPGADQYFVQWRAPFVVRYTNGLLEVYAVPMRPGWTRFMYNRPTGKPGQAPSIAALRRKKMPLWAGHALSANATLDGDTYMLHMAERELVGKEGNRWKSAYYAPGACDAAVVAWRQWLDRWGGEVPTCRAQDPLPPLLPKEQVLDRYSQHTRYCRHCQGAVKRIDLLCSVAAAVGALAAMTAVALLALPLAAATAQPAVASLATAAGAAGAAAAGAAGACTMAGPWAVSAAAALALACAAAHTWLQRFRQHFFYVPYVHAHKE